MTKRIIIVYTVITGGETNSVLEKRKVKKCKSKYFRQN